MSSMCRYLKSSVGKKQLMGISGLLLCGFLVTHLLGNLLIMVSPQAFNQYAHALVHNPLILPAEIALLSLFLFHIVMGMHLTMNNHDARPVKYAMTQKSGRGATFASSTMPYTGLIILAFLIFHIIQFRFGPYYEVTYGNLVMRDLHKLIMEAFSKWWVVAIYIFSMLALGVHVSHGFHSAFQSLGLNHPAYTPKIKILAKIYALIITIGFSVIPLWALCNQGGGL